MIFLPLLASGSTLMGRGARLQPHSSNADFLSGAFHTGGESSPKWKIQKKNVVSRSMALLVKDCFVKIPYRYAHMWLYQVAPSVIVRLVTGHKPQLVYLGLSWASTHDIWGFSLPNNITGCSKSYKIWTRISANRHRNHQYYLTCLGFLYVTITCKELVTWLFTWLWL